jgi:SM-20-related protein
MIARPGDPGVNADEDDSMHSTTDAELDAAALQPTATAIATVVDAIAVSGHAIVPHFLPLPAIAALRAEVLRQDAAGELTAAGFGRGAARREHADVRGDRIRWLDESATSPAERIVRPALESLRLAVNRSLQLGLFTFEGHYALYPPGAYYARHIDRFRDDDARVLSCILYLNDNWRAEDGGALRLHLDGGAQRDVLPEGGTLAAFLADRFPHEVLPATRPRVTLSGWFRRRAGP